MRRNRNHIVEIDGTPLAVIDFEKIDLIFHVQMLWLGGGQRGIIIEPIDREYDSYKRAGRLVIHCMRDTRVGFPEKITILRIDYIKGKIHKNTPDGFFEEEVRVLKKHLDGIIQKDGG